MLGQIFGQATSGVREGAGRVNEATGASEKIDDMIRQITGQSSPELVAKIKELIAQNQLAAGAAAGGLGTILLGTKTGRSLTLDAAKLGGLVLIGGLAYKAYENYTQGDPPRADGSATASHTRPGRIWLRGRGADARSRPSLLPHDDRGRCAVGQIDEKEQGKIFSAA